MSGIRLSPKHGVNPCVPVCFLCGEDKNLLLLLGRIPGTNDAEAPRKAVFDQEPCDKCRGYMKQGIICISVRDGETGDNPYRTGGWWVVRDEMFSRAMKPGPLLDDILKRRIVFIPDTDCAHIGLVKNNSEEKS